MFYSILFATILYIAINLTIGLWNRKGITFESFISNKNNSSQPFVMLSIVATIVGGGMFFATGQMGFEAGIAGLSLPISYAIGFMLLAKFIPRIRKFMTTNNCNTLYDFINIKLSESGKWRYIFNTLVIIINLLIYFFLLAGQFLILSIFYNYFIVSSSNTALLLSVVVIIISTLIYSIFGGVRKDILTDSFQMLCVFFGAIIISCFVFNKEVINSISTLPLKYLNGTGYGIAFPIGVILFFSLSFIVRYDFWQRIIASKSDKKAKQSLYFAIPFVFLFYIIFTLIGMYAKYINPNLIDSNFATIYALKELLPPTLLLVVIIALYGAVMSSADTFLNISTISLYKLVNKNIKVNDSNNLLRIRKYAFLVGILSVLIIFISKNIVNLMVGAFSSLIILSPSMLYILSIKKPNGKMTTINTIISYTIFFIFFFFVKGYEKYAFIIATIISILLHIIPLFPSMRKRKDIISEI